MDAAKKSYDIPKFKEQYDNFIGGEWVAPISGEYFDNISPVDGKPYTKVARSTEEDVVLALDAAHKAAPEWNNASPTTRSNLLWKIADVMEQNLDLLARVETWDNGKPIRETTAADLPLAVDHFRYFAGVIRAEEGGATELDSNTLSVNIKEPLGVVAQIIPWNFPLLMATWKMAPWKHTELTIDVVPGRGASFSLEIPLGVRFVTKSKMFCLKDDEKLIETRPGDMI